LRSKDDVIRIDVVNSVCNAIFPACDGSIVQAAVDPIEHKALMFNLWNAPTDKHVCIVLPRQRRSQTTQVLSNVANTQNWNFLDCVNICYEKTVQSNASSFVKNSETGYLFYKGDFPNLDKTKWFNPEYSNATTTWYLSPQPEETLRNSSYQRFCWDLMLLLVTLSQPLRYGRFVYGLDPNDDNILNFAAFHQIPLQLYTDDPNRAQEIVETYEHIKANMNPKTIAARRKKKIEAAQRMEGIKHDEAN
jgi:hypothetical protein